jgi:hypothetical protein
VLHSEHNFHSHVSIIIIHLFQMNREKAKDKLEAAKKDVAEAEEGLAEAKTALDNAYRVWSTARVAARRKKTSKEGCLVRQQTVKKAKQAAEAVRQALRGAK